MPYQHSTPARFAIPVKRRFLLIYYTKRWSSRLFSIERLFLKRSEAIRLQKCTGKSFVFFLERERENLTRCKGLVRSNIYSSKAVRVEICFLSRTIFPGARGCI